MIRARLTNGTFILGLDAENIRRLTAGEPIKVDLTDHGGRDTVVLLYGATLEAVRRELEKTFGPMPPAQPIPPKGGHRA